jgi:glycerophosphoryl diester phosphodiesterase
MTSPIAHRGLHNADAGRPENSLPAFEFAVRCNIPFEFDIQLTGDGTPVVMHDPDVRRLAGEPIPVAELSRKDIARLRLGTSGERIPTLAEVLALVDGRVPILLDVRRWDFRFDSNLVKAVVTEIGGYSGPMAIMSFDPLSVLRLKRWLDGEKPDERRVGQVSGLLHSAGWFTASIGRTMVTNWLTRPDFIAYELAALPSRYATYWRESWGLPLIAFTVESSEEEQRVTQFADNFLFDGYVPKSYLQNRSLAEER